MVFMKILEKSLNIILSRYFTCYAGAENETGTCRGLMMVSSLQVNSL